MGEGRGLGLYFVNLIVRNGFFGDLTVESDVGWPEPVCPPSRFRRIEPTAPEDELVRSQGTAYFRVLIDFTPHKPAEDWQPETELVHRPR